MIRKLSGIRLPRLKILVIAMILALVVMYLLDRCSHSHTFGDNGLPPKSGGDTLDIAIEISPLAYSLAEDTISGLDYDIIRDLSRIHGRPVKFHPFAPMEYALEGINSGVFDIVVASLASTESLRASLEPTERIYLDREVLLQRKDDPEYISSPDALGGKTIWVADGSPFVERLNNLSEEIGDTIIVRQKKGYTGEHLALLVAEGSIPRAVIGEGLARVVIASHPHLDASTPVSFTQFQVWGVAPGNTALRDTLNAWLDTYRRTPAYDALLVRYLGTAK